MSALPPNIEAQLQAVVDRHAARLGLQLQPETHDGNFMLFMTPTGPRKLLLDLEWNYWRNVLANEEEIMRLAVQMVEEFAGRHGAGKVWAACGLPLVHLINDDGRLTFNIANQEERYARLRLLGAHEATMKPDGRAL